MLFCNNLVPRKEWNENQIMKQLHHAAVSLFPSKRKPLENQNFIVQVTSNWFTIAVRLENICFMNKNEVRLVCKINRGDLWDCQATSVLKPSDDINWVKKQSRIRRCKVQTVKRQIEYDQGNCLLGVQRLLMQHER